MSAYTMKRGLATLLLTTALISPVFAAENCKVTEETDTYIAKQCTDEKGNYSSSITAKQTIEYTTIKETGAVKTQVKKVKETAKKKIQEKILKSDDFKLLPMDQMLRILIEQDPTIKAAEENYKAAIENLKGAYSNYYPKVDVTYGHNNEKDRKPAKSSGVDSISTDSKDGTKATITITQMIWDFGRTHTQVAIQKQTAQKAQVQLEMSIEDKLVEALSSYLNLKKAYNTLEGNQEIETNAKKALAMVIEKVKAGQASKMEQLQIEQQLRTYETIVTQSEIGLSTAQEKFKTVWGFTAPTVGQIVELPADLLGTMPEKTITVNGNKSLRLADYDKVIARAQTELAKAQYRPTLDSSFSVSDYDQSLGEGYGSSKTEWRFDVTLRWTLFNGFKTSTDYKAAINRESAAEYSYVATYRAIQEQVNNLFINHDKLTANLKTLERANAVNKEMYMLTLQDFKAGKSPLIAVFGMKTAEIMSEVALKNAKLDVLIQRYNLNKVVGSIHNPNIK
jgi:outer membrane protein TolC